LYSFAGCHSEVEIGPSGALTEVLSDRAHLFNAVFFTTKIYTVESFLSLQGEVYLIDSFAYSPVQDLFPSGREIAGTRPPSYIERK
jgi:hypothetical protein